MRAGPRRELRERKGGEGAGGWGGVRESTLSQSGVSTATGTGRNVLWGFLSSCFSLSSISQKYFYKLNKL